ncbi:hypothetical protein SBV1_950023 [Verrucomicrobia bacterium]|nr:hypothetical protein SBV1_950023 [Verrucomicrobiota bacterium]
MVKTSLPLSVPSVSLWLKSSPSVPLPPPFWLVTNADLWLIKLLDTLPIVDVAFGELGGWLALLAGTSRFKIGRQS